MDNWKDLLIENPFLPIRYLKHKFPGFESYDLSNWKKKPSVVAVLDLDEWKLSKTGMSQEKARRILSSLWEYYFCNELNYDFKNDPDIVVKLLHTKINRDHLLNSMLSDSSYFQQTGYSYDDWRSKGFTKISFAAFHLFPGKEWCEKNFIDPSLFLQTQFKEIKIDHTLSLMELIWLRHIRKISADDSNKKIETEKKIFYARHMDDDFFNRRKVWNKFGISAKLREGGIKRLEKLLAEKFANDLGISSIFNETWNASRYRRENPNIDFSKCIYTNTSPVDLHHLLERSQFPEFIYHSENVVPISVQMHAYITRGNWTQEIKEKYLLAQKKWINASEGGKINSFKEVMKLISEQIT